MRKYIKLISFVLTVVIISTSMIVPVFANDEISVYLDNEKIQFDVAPLLVNGRTMVPMRAIFEKLGAVVYWDNNTRTAIAQKGNVNVSIAIDDITLYKNGEPIILDVPAQLKNGRTLVPLRAVSEAFDCEVQWNGDAQTVNISTNNNLNSKQIAINKLRTWISNNYNHSIDNETKNFGYKIEYSSNDFQVSYNSDSKDVQVDYTTRSSGGITGFSFYLFDLRFMGAYSYDKGLVISNGYIGGSIYSNSLELIETSYESDYMENKEEILEKFDNYAENTLIIFSDFLNEINIGLTLKDFGLDYDLPEKSAQQVVAFDALKTLVLNRQNDKINGKPVFVYESKNSNQYSIQYNENFDTIRLTIRKIYRGSYTYSSINLTPDRQSYQCSFSFYYPENKSNTPDFEATYIIDAKTFDENSNINFENIKGNKTNINSYKEIAKLMNLEMLDYIDFALKKLGRYISDFGFDLK